MIIQSLRIDRFGKWNGLKLKDLETGINLFYGPNETGKTTLMQFLRTIFYGFSQERLSYVFQNDPQQTGGEIQVKTPRNILRVSRHLTELPDQEFNDFSPTEEASQNVLRLKTGINTENTELPFYAQESFRRRYKTRALEDGLVVTNEKGIRQEAFQWWKLLDLTNETEVGNAPATSLENNEILYNNIFALGLQELQKLSVLDATEASKRLYDLSTGVTRYSSVRILAELVQKRQQILGENALPETLKSEDLQWCGDLSTPIFMRETTGSRMIPDHEIVALLNYRQILQKQQKNIQSQNKKYGKIHSEKTFLSESSEKLTDEIQQQKHKIHILEIALNVQDSWNKRGELDSQIIAFGEQNPNLIETSDHTIELLNENIKKLKNLHLEIQTIKEKRTQVHDLLATVRAKKAESPLNLELLQIVPAIESFAQQQEWIENLRGRLEDLNRQQLDSEAQLAIDYRRLGLLLPDFDSVSSPENIFPYDVRTLRPLRTPMREMRRVRLQIKAEKKRQQELLNEAATNAQKVSTYFQACRTRVESFPQIKALPGMERFPEIFLSKKLNEKNQKNIQQSSVSFKTNALKVVNSSIASEIPPEILGPVANSPNIKDENRELMDGIAARLDANALSAFLGEVLANLRRTEMHITQLETTLKKLGPLEKERFAVLQKRILPFRELCILGGIFTFGLTLGLFETLRLTGILASTSASFSTFLFHLIIFVFGMALCLSCVAFRAVFSQKVERKIAELDEEFSGTLQQRNRLIRLGFGSCEEKVTNSPDSEILELCTRELGKIAQQTSFLEKELSEAEIAGTNTSKRSAILLEVKHHRVRLHKLLQSCNLAKKRRTEVLKSLKLPENWNTANVRLLMDASDRIRELWRRRSRDLEDFHLYENELKYLVERLRKLLPAFGPNFEQEMSGGDARFPFVPAIFSEMQTRIQKELAREQEARLLQQKINENQASLRKLKAEYSRKAQIRTRILENSEVENEKALKQKLERLNSLKELREKRREFQKEIDSEVNFACTESMLWEVFENNSREQIEEKRKVLMNSLVENEFQLSSAQKRIAECETILEKIISDDSPTRIQYELMKTNALIGHAANSWRVFAMTQRLIETIQRTYQLKRQPRTLECASDFLQKMTDGKYERVWTPVDEDILFVQRADGTVFSTEQLSMGTRELLYLAIRLALIDEYRQRNIHLPIILDDVLVNFDSVRATAAARVLTQFAGKETQIFFFTSHEHIREIFARENAVICDMAK